ncbi:MAG TPA: hypothetical protein PLR83_00250 [Pyrinomonadaceae bacterium]|nr:hypothetical protein [Pyrinomonadaceae bacterium]
MTKKWRQQLNRARRGFFLREGEVAVTLNPDSHPLTAHPTSRVTFTCSLTFKDEFGAFKIQRTFRAGRSTMVPRVLLNDFLDFKELVLADGRAASDSILDAEILEDSK